MDKYDDELLNRFADVAEELGWTSNWKFENGCLEMENYSPEGEDLILALFEKDFRSLDSLKYRLGEEYSNFDPEEHAVMWFRQNRGEPSRLRDLLDDAEAIGQMLDDLDIAVHQKLWMFDEKERQSIQGRTMQ